MYITPFNEFLFLIAVTTVLFLVPFFYKTLVPFPIIKKESTPLKKNKLNRFVAFDVMRGVAMLGVIVIHVTYLFPHESLEVKALTLQALDASFRFALPIFYITSGLLLKTPAKGIRGYIRFLWRRAVMILPAYVLVTLILAFLEGLTWRELGSNLVTGKGSVPFYFIIILFQLYLVYPLIVSLSKKRWFVFASFWFSFVSFFMFPTYYILGVPTAFRFVFLFVWGIYMREQLLFGRLWRDWAPWLALVAFCVFVYALLPGQYYNMRPFYGIAVTVLLFMLFTSGMRFGLIEKTLAWIGSMSLWVYLTHFPLMEYVLPFVWENVSLAGYSALALSIVVSIGVSVPFGYVCAKTYSSAVTVFSGKVKR